MVLEVILLPLETLLSIKAGSDIPELLLSLLASLEAIYDQVIPEFPTKLLSE